MGGGSGWVGWPNAGSLGGGWRMVRMIQSGCPLVAGGAVPRLVRGSG